MFLRLPFYYLVLLFLFGGCSIYSSTGRKEFENKAPTYVRTTSLMSCESIEKLPTSESMELVYQNEQLQIFKIQTFSTEVFIRVFQVEEQSPTSCLHQFENQKTWNENRDQFINEYLN